MKRLGQRRFYRSVEILPAAEGFRICLDGRPITTPARSVLCVPAEALAQAIAEEWRGQEERIDFATLPLTRLANSAIDQVRGRREAVIASLGAYAGSDLVCFRAPGPETLVQRQARHWQPLLEWVEATFQAPLLVVEGIQGLEQPESSLEALRDHLRRLPDFHLAGLHHITGIGGSLIIALALMRGRLTVEAAWRAMRVDEDWQAAFWGRDAEAEEKAAALRDDLGQGARFLALLGGACPGA